MAEPAILTSGLCKSFGDVRALESVDLDVSPARCSVSSAQRGGKTTAVRGSHPFEARAGTARVVGLDW